MNAEEFQTWARALPANKGFEVMTTLSMRRVFEGLDFLTGEEHILAMASLRDRVRASYDPPSWGSGNLDRLRELVGIYLKNESGSPQFPNDSLLRSMSDVLTEAIKVVGLEEDGVPVGMPEELEEKTDPTCSRCGLKVVKDEDAKEWFHVYPEGFDVVTGYVMEHEASPDD